MNMDVQSRTFISSLVVRIAAIVVLGSYAGHAQSGEGRPIEFSEPRDKSDLGTNQQQLGSERRRLTDLEDRLSETFRFLDLSDSLSGVPVPPTPRRAPVRTKKQPTDSGLFGEDEDWDLSEDLQALREQVEEEQSLEGRSFEPGERDDRGQGRAELLDSLRSEDWLIKGTLGDTFWQMPVQAEEPAKIDLGWEVLQATNAWSTDRPTTESLLPRMEGLFGQTEVSRPQTVNPGFQAGAFVDEIPDELRHLRRPQADTPQDPYRALLGFGLESEAQEPLVNAALDHSARFERLLDSSRPAPVNQERRPRRLTDLVQSPDPAASSLYPVAPALPQGPGAFDALQVEQLPTSRSRSADAFRSPFYEPPRRDF